MLKIYTDKRFLSEKYRKQIFPLLFDMFFLKSKKTLSCYQFVDSIEFSDIVVFPIDYVCFFKYTKAYESLKEIAVTANKPIWVYTGGDYGFTINAPNFYTFRFSGFKSQLPKNTFILPAFMNDPYKEHLNSSFSIIKKDDKPTIGFVGHANASMSKFFREALVHYKTILFNKLKKLQVDSYKFYSSSFKRAKYLNKLEDYKSLQTNFIYRSKYRSGAKTEQEKEITTREFYENMFNNLYTFCLRGVGNFSIRFYEALAVGRIPILFDTDCELPFAGVIDWQKHCLIIDVSDSQSIEKQILNFHNSLSSAEFEELQKGNRKLWEEYLERQSYFIRIHSQFKSKLLQCN